MPRQSTNDETELQEQPRVDGVDEEEIDDLPDWGKMEVCLYFQLIAGFVTFLDTSPWQCYYSPVSRDCTTAGVSRRFPGIFQDRRQESPRNFTVTYFEREAIELGGLFDYYYPGITVDLIPEYPVSDRTRGYEVILRKDRQTTCLIVIIPAHTSVEKVTQELFPLSGTTHYRISVHSLPVYPSNNGHVGNDGNDHVDTTVMTEVLDVVTGPFDDYRPGGRYPAPADWVAVIQYMVNEYQNGSGQSLDIVFSRPPDHYNFRRFQVALVGLPEEENIEIQVDVTNNFWHVFPDVKPGHYRVSVKPLDDFFSLTGQCLCYNGNGLCTNCWTTETEIFTVD